VIDEPARSARSARPIHDRRHEPQPSPGTAAFYAAQPGGWRDWWNLLHVPYTAWHLAYVVIGASLAAHADLSRLLATLLAFFLAVGIAAHALDEMRGRPLRTQIPTSVLFTVSTITLVAAVALGIAGVSRVGWPLIPFLVVGPLLVVGYNLELLGGVIHTDAWFAAGWGAFPVLTAYVAQTGRLSIAAVLAAAGAFALSRAQRQLSTPARLVRRRVSSVEGRMVISGEPDAVPITASMLLGPLELALRAMSWAIVLLAASMAVAQFG
jgi:hypothetical protein